jgi:hypothetical protein
MNWRDRIVSDPHTLHGKPRVRGTRIPVSVVLDNVAARVDLVSAARSPFFQRRSPATKMAT